MKLLPHQVEAVDKRRRNAGMHPNFLLGDSMGVGKTASAIGIDFDLRREHGSGRFRTLIVCNKNGIAVWKYHLVAMGVPEKYILAIDAKDRSIMDAELAAGATNYTYYIIHYNALTLLKWLLPEGRKSIVWDHLIADEVQYIKSRKVTRTLVFKRIKAKIKTGASGTPADDKPQDIWSVLNWLYPRKYSSYWRFFNTYIEWVNEVSWATGKPVGYRKITGVKNVEKLHAQVRPFYIRRLLTDVVDDMPDKTTSEIRVQLTPAQRRAYDQMDKWQTAHLGLYEEEGETEDLVLRSAIAKYMRLLQFALGTCEIDWEPFNKFWTRHAQTPLHLLPVNSPKGPKVRIKEPSPKIDALFEEFETYPDEQFVVFTNFKDVADIVERRCQDKGITTGKITGAIVSQRVRDEAVAGFQAGRNRIFVGTIKAAGTAITLTAAHQAYMLDRNWNPSVNVQAEDRIWRIGQKNICNITDIIADDTVDEPRIRKILFKGKQVEKVVNIHD